MFTEFLQQGSITAVVLMAYANFVMIETINAERSFLKLNSSRIIEHPFTQYVRFLGLPCIFWPSIYIGLFSGIWSGLLAFVLIQIFGVIISLILRIKAYPGVHLIPACFLMIIGYYLSLTNLPV